MVTFTLEDNFKGYLNDSIHILGQLRKNKKSYRNMILFSVAAVEIGLKIILSERYEDQDGIFEKELKEIESIIKKEALPILKEKFKILFDNGKDINFSTRKFKKLMGRISGLRNDLIHAQGEFEEDKIESSILEMLCRLQYILPDSLNYKSALSDKNFKILQNEKDFISIDNEILKELEFVVFDKDTYDTDYFFNCPRCVSQMHRAFLGYFICFICPVCLDTINCFLCEDCVALTPEEDGYKLNKNNYFCDSCYRNKFRD